MSCSIDSFEPPIRRAAAMRSSTVIGKSISAVSTDGHAFADRPAHHGKQIVAGADLRHGCAGQRRDRVEGDIAGELDPDLATNVRHRVCLEPGLAQKRGGAGSVIGRPLHRTEQEPTSRCLAHGAWAGNLGREMRHRANKARLGEASRERAVRIDRAHRQGCSGRTIPPRDSVEHGNDDGFVDECCAELSRRLGQIGCLDAEEQHFDRRQLARIGDRLDRHAEIAARRTDVQPVPRHGGEMRSTGDDVDGMPGAGQPGGDHPADRAGAEHCNAR